jgi:hypothetical protein
MAGCRGAVGRGVESPLDPHPSLVEAMIDPIALAIEAAIDAIAAVLCERGGGEDEPRNEGSEREGETAAHGLFLR